MESSTSRFVGESAFLRVWPMFMVAFGLYLALHGGVTIGVVFAICGCISASALPWRFSVFDDGLFLQFAFGKRRFLAREDVLVRVARSGSVALRPGHRFGYPLSDRLVERRTATLRAVLVEHGYDVAS